MLSSRMRCLAITALTVLSLPLTGKEPIMPLSEVEPGMKGEWKSVVSGTQVESFALEVLGIAKNFIGPKRALIICPGDRPKIQADRLGARDERESSLY